MKLLELTDDERAALEALYADVGDLAAQRRASALLAPKAPLALPEYRWFWERYRKDQPFPLDPAPLVAAAILEVLGPNGVEWLAGQDLRLWVELPVDDYEGHWLEARDGSGGEATLDGNGFCCPSGVWHPEALRVVMLVFERWTALWNEVPSPAASMAEEDFRLRHDQAMATLLEQHHAVEAKLAIATKEIDEATVALGYFLYREDGETLASAITELREGPETVHVQGHEESMSICRLCRWETDTPHKFEECLGHIESDFAYAATAATDPGPGGFGVDPRDSASLLELRAAIDDHLGWRSEESERNADYVERVKEVGLILMVQAPWSRYDRKPGGSS